MQEKISEIAARLRELRKLSGLELGPVAEGLGIPPGQYAAYEEGTADIPASILVELAQLFRVETAVLLTGEDPRMNVFTVTRAGKGAEVERREGYRYQGLAANFAHKKAEPFLVAVDPLPPGSPIPTNAHPGQEMDYVLEGRLRVRVRGNEVDLGPGDAIFFDSNHSHGMAALDGAPAKFLAIIL